MLPKRYRITWVFSPSNEWDLLSESDVNFYISSFGGETIPALKVIEESSYVVISPGDSGYSKGELILESVHRLLEKYDTEYRGGIGAEAIKDLLSEY